MKINSIVPPYADEFIFAKSASIFGTLPACRQVCLHAEPGTFMPGCLISCFSFPFPLLFLFSACSGVCQELPQISGNALPLARAKILLPDLHQGHRRGAVCCHIQLVLFALLQSHKYIKRLKNSNKYQFFVLFHLDFAYVQ